MAFRVKSVVSVSNTLVLAILEGMGEDARVPLLAKAGLSEKDVRDVNGRTSIFGLNRLWQSAIERTEDPFLGLRIGLTVPVERFGLAAQAARQSESVRTALERFARYVPLINGLLRCRIDVSQERARLALWFLWDALALERHAIDITFAATAQWLGTFVPGFALRELHLRHAMEEGTRRYVEVFGIEPRLGAETNALVFDAHVLDAPIDASAPDAAPFLERFAEIELQRLPALGSLPERVTQILEREIGSGRRAELADVATELRMSARQLQRKLSEASTSFSALQDDARKTLAPSMLAADGANVEQVAFSLGFADPTAFIRAFKRWFGVTPGTFQRTRR
jgi:AraC-like DNA-binding protein